MKKTKQSLYQKYLFKYRDWKSRRQMKTLNTMIKYDMFEAIRLANKKRDIINNKIWVVGNPGQYLVFARYQRKSLQSEHLLDGNLTGKNLDEIASYIAYPITVRDQSRGGHLNIFGKKSPQTNPRT
jgi:hypothetical protein